MCGGYPKQPLRLAGERMLALQTALRMRKIDHKAARIAMAALTALKQSPEVLLLLLPSDHAVRNDAASARA